MYDIVIKNARIADGTGNPLYHADVAVKDGKNQKIGPNLQVEARNVIDGTGKVLAPGFIDAHSHLESIPMGANMTFLVGHSMLRAVVMGYENRKAR